MCLWLCMVWSKRGPAFPTLSRFWEQGKTLLEMIIELTGPPGVGKSSVTRALCRALIAEGKDVYYPREGEPRPHRYWRRSLPGTRTCRRALWTLIFLIRHAKLAATTIRLQVRWTASLREKLYLMWGFVSAGALDLVLRHDQPAGAIVILEEGLLQRGVSLFSSVKCSAGREVLERYVRDLPHVDLTLSVEASAETCLERICERNVRPKRTRGLATEDLRRFVLNQRATAVGLVELQRNQGASVVTVDNSKSMDCLAAQVRTISRETIALFQESVD